MAFTSNQQRTHIPSMIVTSYDQCLGDKRHPPLNMIDPGHSDKYLGIWVDSWSGFADSGLSEKLED